uniref:Uncharacterized protein n=1 Tax=Rhizophora mucronata TaxID=61149 RepID=A0A2P2NP61_RHIMU
MPLFFSFLFMFLYSPSSQMKIW